MQQTQDTRFMPTTSDNYAVIKTADIICKLEGNGFKLVDFQKQRVSKKNAAKEGYQAHVVTMELINNVTALSSKGSPRIVFKNSHDGTKSLEFFVGFIRFACSNGLIVGSSITKSLKLRHSGDVQTRVNEVVEWSVIAAKKLVENFTAMSQVQLSNAQVIEFANKAAKLRGLETIDITPKREEDLTNDLFTVYNRIQESIIRGSQSTKLKLVDDKQVVVSRKSRPVKSPIKDLQLNLELSNLAASYLPIAA